MARTNYNTPGKTPQQALPGNHLANRAPQTQQPDPAGSLIALMKRNEPEIKRALPRLGITSERFTRLCLTALRMTPKLLSCEPHSVLAAMMNAAQLGLEPNSPLGHCWMLPYGSNAQLIIGYKGYIALADRSAVTLNAAVVRERDHWRWPRPGETIIDHVPYQGSDPGDIICAYAYALRPDRPLQFRVISLSDIERARSASPAVQRGKKDSPWFTNYEAMVLKTAIRRLVSFLPISSELARAVELDDQAELGEIQYSDLTPPDTRSAIKADQIENKLEQAQGEVSPDRETISGGEIEPPFEPEPEASEPDPFKQS